MNERPLRLGISTCPNDTFLFHALLSGEVEVAGHRLEIELLDVQELNERLIAGDFDVAKASYHLALRLADELVALPTGSALGFGNGPLLLARAGLESQRPGAASRVLCPGEHTTASLLYRAFHEAGNEAEQVVFSEIMPALEAGDADFGVCIHEGRFTYAERGLALVEDLGSVWETATASPLPLGGIFARRGLGDAAIDAVQDALVRSLDRAEADRDATLPTMKRYAQELSDDVVWSHVDLYVNEWTRDLGDVGRAAIDELARRGAAAGVVPGGASLAVFEPFAERRVFHLVPLDGADEVPESGTLAPPSLDAEGFVHLSFPEQLAGTLDVHFEGVERVLLLELDRARVQKDVRHEISRGGASFPHLYRALDLTLDVTDRWELVRSDGRFRLPQALARRS
ncbi:MAG: MqnA/MqnD/SBP family protein [Planctomycetota bacterium]